MLTQIEIDSFHTHGFLILRGLFHGTELTALQQAAETVVADGLAGRGAGHRRSDGPDGQPVYWRSEQVWARDPVFRAATVHPRLLAAIGQCVGQSFFPWNDSLVVKLPRRGSQVPWHQDPPYGFPAADFVPHAATGAIPNFTTDIYLDRSDRGNGCVWAIPGRHLVGHIAWPDMTQEDLFNHPEAVPLEMEAGDVLFHCLSTPHGSRPNRSERIRRVFYVHYISEQARQEAYGRGDSAWVHNLPVWGDERRAFIAEAEQQRHHLGFASMPAGACVGPDGIAISGLPASRPRHWEPLIAAIPPEQRAGYKLLARPAVRSEASR